MIYLDADGVLVDFDKGLLDNYGVTNCLVTYGTADKDKTPEQWALSKTVWECMNSPGFFRNLPPMAGYKELWKAASALSKDVFILTAFPAHNGVSNDQVKQDKWNWFQEYLPVTKDRFIFCERKDKIKYATWTSKHGNEANILVDDLELNCQEWDAEGGTAIHHVYGQMGDTIKQLSISIQGEIL